MCACHFGTKKAEKIFHVTDSYGTLRCCKYRRVLKIPFFLGVQESALQGATGQAFRTGEGCPRQELRERAAVDGRAAKQTG